ncbi:MAG: Ig-like domain-containing protein [Clostridia bacterium]|nr:Ig-like domain-containing protein [Clostridia bacterium]
MKKKLLVLFLSLILAICILGVVLIVCKPSDNPKGPDEGANVIRFIDTPQSMVLGEILSLTYVTEGDEQQEIKFSSSNQEVATIDKTAKIEALKPGQTTITGEFGESIATFTLTVVKDDGLPQLLFNNYFGSNNEVTITKNGQLSFDAYVFYNGRNFDDGKISYYVDNEENATINSEGVLTAHKKGSVKVTVSASWREINSPLLTKEIIVKIDNDVQLLLANGNLTIIKLYTLSSFKGTDYDTSFNLLNNAKFIVNGEDLSNVVTYTLSDGGEIATIDQTTKTLTAKKHGSEKLIAQYNDGNEIYTHTVDVIVERPVYEYENNVYFSQVDGEIKELDDIFGEDVIISDAYQGGLDKTGSILDVENNVIKDFKLNDIRAYQNDIITVYTDKCGIKLNVTASYKIIRTAQDLTSLYNGSSITDGCFLVANDIKYDKNVVIKPEYTNYGTGSTFKGVFDGNGHTIEYGLNKGGLFGNLNSATIKNASFVVKQVNSETASTSTDLGMYAILAGYMASSTIENVYATYDVQFTPDLSRITTTYRYRSLGLFGASNLGTLKNVVINLSNVKDFDLIEDMGYGVTFAPLGSAYSFGSAESVYVIWDVKELLWYNGTPKLAYAINDAKTYTKPQVISDFVEEYLSKDSNNKFTEKQLDGVIRFDNYDVAKEYFTANKQALEDLSSFVDVSRGFPYEGENKYLVSSLDTIYFDGEVGDEAFMPASLVDKEISKIIDIENENNLFYENNAWKLQPNVLNEKVVYTGYVYDDKNILIGVYDIVSVKKVLTEAKDLTSLYNGGNTLTGYYLVLNDINYDSSLQIKPTYEGYGAGSKFGGVFDGNGHTIEYGVVKGGLFGNLINATVKNAKFVVKSVPSTASSASYSIIAGFEKYSILENVYATYQLEDNEGLKTLNITKTGSGRTTRYGLGLFAGTYDYNNKSLYSNVIVDLSNVNYDDTADTSPQYGVLVSPYEGTTIPAIKNCFVIWNKTLLINGTYNSSGSRLNSFASNDEFSSTDTTVKQLTGVSRYATLTDMAKEVTKVGNFTINSSGVAWNNN